MKISKNLLQFNRQKALIIVSGRTAVRFLYAHQGEIKELDRFRFPRRLYTDREGFFKTKVRGLGTMYSGSVLESKKAQQEKKLLKKITDKVKSYNKKLNITGIYLFAPDYMKGQAREAVPRYLQKKIRGCLYGNYLKSKLLKFPHLIGKKQRRKRKQKSSPEMSREARKIIKRSKSARKKIKGKP